MKQSFALLSLVLSLHAHSQKANVLIKFSPPALIDIVSFPTIQGGVEFKLSDRLSWYHELGIKYFEPYKPDTNFIHSYG